MDWVALLTQIVVSIVLIAPVLWLAGRWLAGKEKAKFTDAIWIVVLGVIIGSVLVYYISSWAAWLVSLIMIVLWLGLIKHFFDCGWIKAFVIAIIGYVIYIVVWAILDLLFGWGQPLPPLPGL
jgi:DNA integrity scanning protein DisA with diadenylate cyclase activity